MPDRLIVRLRDPQDKPTVCETMYTVDMQGLPFWSEWRAAGPQGA